MEEVFPNEPYRLLLKDRRGDPRDAGVLVFEIQGATLMPIEAKGFTNEASWADLREVYVTVSALGGAAEACEVTVRAPIAWAHDLNAGIATVFSTIGGFFGAGAGAGIGAALAGTAVLGPAIVPVALVGGLALGAAATTKGMRMLYRHGLRVGERALDGLLGDVALRAQGGWGLSKR